MAAHRPDSSFRLLGRIHLDFSMLLPFASAFTLALTGYTFHLAIGAPPPSVPKGQRSKGVDLFDFNLWFKKTFRIYQILLYGILSSEVATLLFRIKGGPLSRESHYLMRMCPSTFDRVLYPQDQLPIFALIGCSISIAGSILRVWSQRSLGRFFTWEVSVRPGHRLYTGGPYSFVRHPSYTALIMSCCGQALLLRARHTFLNECTKWSYPLLTWIGLGFMSIWEIILVGSVLNRTVTEDRVLKREFGKEWVDWSQRARYRVLPGIY